MLPAPTFVISPRFSKRIIAPICLVLASLCVFHASEVSAELSVPDFISDHMVLQRNSEAKVWGTAAPSSKVTAFFKGQSFTTTSNREGQWAIGVATGEADSKGSVLRIESGDLGIEIMDVLVGEVWFASGQSNMVFTMNRVREYSDVIAEADHPGIRMFNADTVTAVEPQNNIDGDWSICSRETAPRYSAVAFFFAQHLHQELGVPVGVIKSAWGGKPVETFTSREALTTLPATRKLVDAAVQADADFDETLAMSGFEKRLASWGDAMSKWRLKPADSRGRAPRRPAVPKRPLNTEGQPGVLFNSMIHPFIGYTIRGAIWYQGEGNAKPGAVPYDQTLPLMINDWRQRWASEFSFYFVQLANFRQPSTEPGNSDPWPLLQDRMRRVLMTTPKTGMAIINDVGQADDIHPKNKHDVGKRLALWALAKDYDKSLVYSGPLLKNIEFSGNSAIIHFDHVGDGLKTRAPEQPLSRFEIAGNDKVWHWGNAKITGTNTVLVSCEHVPRPVAVRYAWAANPKGANLVNSAELPASVFRTDHWKDVMVAAKQDNDVRTKALADRNRRRELAKQVQTIKAEVLASPQGSDGRQDLLKKQRQLLQQFKALLPKQPNQ